MGKYYIAHKVCGCSKAISNVQCALCILFIMFIMLITGDFSPPAGAGAGAGLPATPSLLLFSIISPHRELPGSSGIAHTYQGRYLNCYILYFFDCSFFIYIIFPRFTVFKDYFKVYKIVF